MRCYSKLSTQLYNTCEFYTATLNQAHFHSVAQRFLHFSQLIFLRQKRKAPLRRGGVRVAALSTEKQASNLWRKLTCDVCMPKDDGAS